MKKETELSDQKHLRFAIVLGANLICLLLLFFVVSSLRHEPLPEVTKSVLQSKIPQDTKSCIGSPDDSSWDDVNRWDSEVLAAIEKVFNKEGVRVPANRIKAHMMIESGGDPDAVQKNYVTGFAYGLMQITKNAYVADRLNFDQIMNPEYNLYAGALELAVRYKNASCNKGWDGASYGYFGGDPCGLGLSDPYTGYTPASYNRELQDLMTELDEAGCAETASPSQSEQNTPPDAQYNTPTPTAPNVSPFVCLGNCPTPTVTEAPLPPCPANATPPPSSSKGWVEQLQAYLASLREKLDQFFSDFQNQMQAWSSRMQSWNPLSSPPPPPPPVPPLPGLPPLDLEQAPGQEALTDVVPCVEEEPIPEEEVEEPTSPLEDEEEKYKNQPKPDVSKAPSRTMNENLKEGESEENNEDEVSEQEEQVGRSPKPLPSQNVQEIKQAMCQEYRVCPTRSSAYPSEADWTLEALTALWNVVQRMYASPTYVAHAIGAYKLEVARSSTYDNDGRLEYGSYRGRASYTTIPGARLIVILDRAFTKGNYAIANWEWLFAHEIAHSAGSGTRDGAMINNPPSNQTHQRVVACSDPVSQYGDYSPTRLQEVSEDENYADAVSFYLTTAEEAVLGYHGTAKNLKADHPCAYNALRQGYFDNQEF